MKYQITIGPHKTSVDRWRAQADWLKLSSQARVRLEWVIFYYTVGNKNTIQTAKHFGIHRSCLHEWLKRFNSLDVTSLESSSRRPHTLRTWTVTQEEEQRVIALREKHLAWGKQKLKIMYEREYGETISTWKIERVVRKHHLYPDPREHQKRAKRRKSRAKRVRIHTLDTTKYEPGKLWHIDSIEINWYKEKRYIITALEDKTKLAFARVYPTHAAKHAADFLKRLVYLSQGDIAIVHSDNGTEFAGKFEEAIKDLQLFQVYSRVRTPNDNPSLERFNRTIQEEWLNLSEIGLDDIQEANHDLTDWLVEYNSVRPHQALDYKTPLAYAHTNYFAVSPMYPASTTTRQG